MARPLRLEFPGALYHVTSRGDRREPIFEDDSDRLTFLDLLADVVLRFDWVCHAYCLMTNHYHLMIETRSPNLSKGMRHLNGVYSQRYNRRHGLVGHVFQGRFHAIVVDSDAYLLELARYIVLNPVRAKLVDSPEKWQWSSYRSIFRGEPRSGGLTVEALLKHFGPDRGKAEHAYREFVSAGFHSESPWANLKSQIFLGDDQFVRETQKQMETHHNSPEIPARQRREPAKPIEFFQGLYADRKLAMRAAYQSGHYSMAEIARHFDVHYSTVSRAINS